MTQEIMISADSHVVEPYELWSQQLPSAMREYAPTYTPLEVKAVEGHPGGKDPRKRIGEMRLDGVSAEVLYPSLALNQFGISDPELQRACLGIYNDWLIEYCSSAPDRLLGIGAVSTFDIEAAIREMHRCKSAGLRGVMVWQVPPEQLSFKSGHYDRFWAAAQEAELPVSLHILTGVPFRPGEKLSNFTDTPSLFDLAVHRKLYYAMSALGDLIGSGVMERFPRLKFVLVENEVSWLPFVIGQWDKYAARKMTDGPMKLTPGEYCRRQVFATYVNDPASRGVFQHWGAGNLMWSNDYPHSNSSWPKSRDVVARDFEGLDEVTRSRLLSGNVSSLYGLPPFATVS